MQKRKRTSAAAGLKPCLISVPAKDAAACGWRPGYKVTALDISPSALAHIRRQNPEIETVCGDIAGFDGGRRRYDWVLADLSLHYWDDAKTRAIVAEIYKTLNPGGCFSVACKSVSDFEYGQGTEVGPDIFEHGHVRHFFRLEYLRELLQSFEIAKINECERNERHYGRYRAAEAVAFKPG